MARSTAPEAPLVGREAALRQLDENSHRLLCILGPPGVGKSRLCREWVARRGDDAIIVDVSSATDATGVRALVGRALSFSMRSAGPEVDREITRALAARGPFALVLDDVTSVGGSPNPLEIWLAGAPELRIVTTSRRRLGIASEAPFPLSPLELPSGPEFPATSAALRLFIERARHARPDLEVNQTSVALAARLVSELDGLPLAIELCAARCRMLSLAELLDRIEQHSKRSLLTSAGEKRERLDDAIVASFDLLTREGKEDLTRLSAFAGSFDLAAAEAVLGVEPTRAMDVVESFLDQSLLSPEASLRTTDSPRFRLLRPIRDAATALAPEAREVALERFAGHFARTGIVLAQRAVHGDGDAERRLSLDRENLIAAHERAVQANNSSRAMRTAIALGVLMWSEGPLSACLEYLTRAVARAPQDGAAEGLIALAHGGRAAAFLALGRLEDAVAAKKEAEALAPKIQSAAIRARVTRQIAKITQAEGDWSGTNDALELSLALSLSAGNQYGVAYSRLALGDLCYYRDDLAGALAHFEAARAIMSTQRARYGIALATSYVGQVQVELGRNVEAQASLEDAIVGFEETRNRRGQADAWLFLGILEHASGRLEEALSSFDRALYLARTSDFRRCEGNGLGYRAGCLLEAGQDREAIRDYTSAIDCLREAGFTTSTFFHGGLAVALARSGDRVGALAALDTARHPRQRVEEQPFAAHTLALHAAHIEWLHVQLEGSSSEERARGLERARAALATGGPEQTDVRFARRLLEQALVSVATPVTTTSSMDIQIARSGRWFERSEIERVDLQRRRALRMCLAELARMRIERPGVALSVEDIVRIGWPGEKIHPEAARERVYTAITTLRRFGLKEALKRRDEGYLIDPSQPVTLVDDGL